MSAVTAPSTDPVSEDEPMLSIKRQAIFGMLITFFDYARRNWTLEAYNYLPINFILLMFALTSKHPDPNVVLGVNPQGCLEAAFGKPVVRTHPDFAVLLLQNILSLALGRAIVQSKPLLGFLWEDKKNKFAPNNNLSVADEFDRVKQAAEKAIPFDLEQLRRQAMCAFFHYSGDVLYTFLTYRDCFSLFKFVRPSDWDAKAAKYRARFANKGEKEWVFEEDDLPIPTAPYSCLAMLEDGQTEFTIYFRNAFKLATASLGLLHDENPLFRLPPGITEEELKQPGPNKAQEAINELTKEVEPERLQPERPAPVNPNTSDDSVKDGHWHPDSQETSVATSAGSCDTGASEPPLSPVHMKVPTGSAGPSERGARHIARQERADAAQEPEEQSVADASEESAAANASAELPLAASAGLSLSAALVFDPDEAQACSTPIKPAAVAPAPARRVVVALAESSETGTLDAVAPNADPAIALPPANEPVAPADVHLPITDDGSANPEQPGADQATAGASNEGQSSQPAMPALIARPKRKKTAKAAGAHAPDDAPGSEAGGPALAGPSNANAVLVFAAPAGQIARSSSRVKAQGSGQSVDAPAADGSAKTQISKKRAQPGDNQGAGNAAAAPSGSKKRKLAPAAQALDDAPGPSNTQRRVNPPRNCKTGGKKKIQ